MAFFIEFFGFLVDFERIEEGFGKVFGGFFEDFWKIFRGIFADCSRIFRGFSEYVSSISKKTQKSSKLAFSKYLGGVFPIFHNAADMGNVILFPGSGSYAEVKSVHRFRFEVGDVVALSFGLSDEDSAGNSINPGLLGQPKKVQSFFPDFGISDPWTGPIGFGPKFYAKLVSSITRRIMKENRRFLGESSWNFA